MNLAAAAILEPMPMTSPASRPARARLAPVLTRRELGRALLARQMLLGRGRVSVAGAVERLVGLQAQNPSSPYYALWSRLEGFQPDDLGRLVASRRMVRSVLMRATLHLTSARDCLALHPVMRVVLERGFRSSDFARRIAGVDRDQLLDCGRRLLEAEPRTGAQLARLLAARWPRRDPASLSQAVRYLLPLAQIAPRGVWGQSLQATWTTIETYLGQPLAATPPAKPEHEAHEVHETIVRRYLAAFGPASAADVQTWCGLTGLRPVLEGMRSRLRAFRDERGIELFDLPRAPRPPADTPAPPRFLPDFDNVLLSHADRSRIIAPEDWRRMVTVGLLGTVLVDGLVAGTWRIDRPASSAHLLITAFRPLSARDRAEVAEEGLRLLAFAAPEAVRPTVRFGR